MCSSTSSDSPRNRISLTPRPRWTGLRTALTVVALLALASVSANACPVCFASKNESRIAYYVTTAILMTLPWAMVVGLGYAYHRRARGQDDSAARRSSPDSAPSDASSDKP